MRIVTQPPVFVLASISLTFGLLGINQGEFVAAFSNHPRIGSLRKHASSQPRLNNNKIYPTTTRYRRIKETDLRSTPLVIPKSAYFLSLLALQFGLQPILTKKFTPNNIIRSTVVLAQDTSRFLICLLMIFLTGNFNISVQKWTLQQALLGAGIPSALYLVQNYCSLMAYQNLPPITYNILNQTKTLSAALCCYLVMGKRQSPLQVVSLLVLLMSALVLEKIVPVGNWKTKSSKKGVIEEHKEEEFTTLKRPDLPAGVIPILVASFISGLAGALSQRNLQFLNVNSYVFSMELSAFSIIIMLTSLSLGTPDGKRLREGKILEGWTWKTWIPVITNAAGGVLVGLVTKHAGAVKKGFALIFGLILSGILQSYFTSNGDGLTTEQLAGGLLASISLWMHSAFPP